MTISSSTSLSCVGRVIRQLRGLLYSVIATLSASPVVFYEIISVCHLAIKTFFPLTSKKLRSWLPGFLLARRSMMSWRRLPISIYLFLEHFAGHLVRCSSKNITYEHRQYHIDHPCRIVFVAARKWFWRNVF